MLALSIGCFIFPIIVMLFCYWQAKVVLYKPSTFNSASTNENNPTALNADWVNQKEITTVWLIYFERPKRYMNQDKVAKVTSS